jgi:trimeric autotransporter adhesin
MANFAGQAISESYQRVLQVDGGVIQNGAGNVVNGTIESLAVVNALSANTVNLLTLGLGGSNVNTNITLGNNSLTSNTTGYQNIALGESALNQNTEGNNNVALGNNALREIQQDTKTLL